MIKIILALGPILLMLVISEYFWREKLVRGESARKLLHIVIGAYVATWPAFLSFTAIQNISAAFLVVVLLSQRFNIFKAINDVKRKTWGDVLYALGIGLAATLTRDPWIFAVAILFMSLSDGMAGLVGSHFGKNSLYTIFGNKKSIVGTLAFILCSFAILIGIQTVHSLSLSPLMFVVLPFMAAALENLGALGSDNILIPVLVVLALS